jgi:hypothetical protein
MAIYFQCAMFSESGFARYRDSAVSTETRGEHGLDRLQYFASLYDAGHADRDWHAALTRTREALED